VFEVMVEDTFDAAHCLRGYQGNCEKLHGHTYRVQCVLRRDELDERGISFDFREVKRALTQAVERLDHVFLNDLPEFSTTNPTAENLARTLFAKMRESLGRSVARITVWETSTSAATYFEED
jgi:6-pyruvoyltetrahydropterin/6-carboxytetrahydropterin synthase